MSGLWGRGVRTHVPMHRGNGHVWDPSPVDRMTDRQTPVKTLPSRNFVCEEVNMSSKNMQKDANKYQV